MKNKSGFTLVEILVVVLIIGILTAIAVPMYQSAVDKTHWSTLLPTARALKNAEEAHLMATNVYTDNEDALDVAATEGDATYQLQMPDSAARYVIRGSTTKLPNVRLAQYLDENASYGNLLFCEAATDDERANKLCEKTLNGQRVYTTDDSYTAYLMDSPCRKGVGYLDNGKCGYENKSGTKNNKLTLEADETCTNTLLYGQTGDRCAYTIIEDGASCIARGDGGCGYATINAGGECIAYRQDGCNFATINGGKCISASGWSNRCYHATVKEQGVIECNAGIGYCGLWSSFNNSTCVGNITNACTGSSFKNGSICYANEANACGAYNLGGSTEQWSTYDETSCCCGQYCSRNPNARLCDASRCDPQYMK